MFGNTTKEIDFTGSSGKVGCEGKQEVLSLFTVKQTFSKDYVVRRVSGNRYRDIVADTDTKIDKGGLTIRKVPVPSLELV